MRKVYNFNAGPSMLPEEVLLKAQAELLDWNDTGMSIMELGHRSPEFQEIAHQAEKNLRDLMHIPTHYQVFFLPGGASAQFAMIPLNLFQKKKADYINTGIWSKKAIDEAVRYGDVHVAATLQHRDKVSYIPHQEQWTLRQDIDYIHYTPNETINAVQFHWLPQVGNIPLVADMSSMILSQPIDVRQFGLIYAGAQKNAGQAGITLVIIREDLIQEPAFLIPTLYTYKVHMENHSFYNTPPTYSWYIAGLMFEWMKNNGGVEAFYEINKRKAKKLYDFIDKHPEFYICNIHPECRSMMNIAFTLQNETLTNAFLTESNEAGLTNLKGHKVAGGLRASIYNAMPEEGVDALIHFMQEFIQKHG